MIMGIGIIVIPAAGEMIGEGIKAVHRGPEQILKNLTRPRCNPDKLTPTIAAMPR